MNQQVNSTEANDTFSPIQILSERFAEEEKEMKDGDGNDSFDVSIGGDRIDKIGHALDEVSQTLLLDITFVRRESKKIKENNCLKFQHGCCKNFNDPHIVSWKFIRPKFSSIMNVFGLIAILCRTLCLEIIQIITKVPMLFITPMFSFVKLCFYGIFIGYPTNMERYYKCVVNVFVASCSFGYGMYVVYKSDEEMMSVNLCIFMAKATALGGALNLMMSLLLTVSSINSMIDQLPPKIKSSVNWRQWHVNAAVQSSFLFIVHSLVHIARINWKHGNFYPEKYEKYMLTTGLSLLFLFLLIMMNYVWMFVVKDEVKLFYIDENIKFWFDTSLKSFFRYCHQPLAIIVSILLIFHNPYYSILLITIFKIIDGRLRKINFSNMYSSIDKNGDLLLAFSGLQYLPREPGVYYKIAIGSAESSFTGTIVDNCFLLIRLGVGGVIMKSLTSRLSGDHDSCVIIGGIIFNNQTTLKQSIRLTGPYHSMDYQLRASKRMIVYCTGAGSTVENSLTNFHKANPSYYEMMAVIVNRKHLCNCTMADGLDTSKLRFEICDRESAISAFPLDDVKNILVIYNEYVSPEQLSIMVNFVKSIIDKTDKPDEQKVSRVVICGNKASEQLKTLKRNTLKYSRQEVSGNFGFLNMRKFHSSLNWLERCHEESFNLENEDSQQF